MINKFLFALTYVVSISLSLGMAQQVYEPIILDEEYEDWSQFDNIGGNENESFAELKASNTDEFLFVYWKMNFQTNLQNYSPVVLYIDSDNNPGTGKDVNEIGAELELRFGNRDVYAYFGSSNYKVGFYELFTVIAPTVWSDKFEISIKRDAEINGKPVFEGNEIKLVIADENNNKRMPASGGALYTFNQLNFNPIPAYQFTKPESADVRVMSYNVEFDGFFKSERVDAHNRILNAIAPDIIGFQEIYDHTSQQIAARVEEILPSAEGEQWNGANVNDNHIITRYTIKEKASVGGFGNGAFLVDLRPDYNTDLFIINAHTPCCDNDNDRQREIDAFIEFIREIKEGTGVFEVAPNTPIIVMGDMNLVGDPRQVITLLEGDIKNNSSFGNDINPDWDETALKDAKPLTAGLPMTYTHISNPGDGRYSSGRLDYIAYSNSVMDMENSYVLHTNVLDADTLSAYGMEQNDAYIASDHLPMVADFSFNGNTPASANYNSETVNKSLICFPNPSDGNVRFLVDSDKPEDIDITIFTENGQELDSIRIKSEVGRNEIHYTEKLGSGMYFVSVKREGFTQFGKMVIL